MRSVNCRSRSSSRWPGRLTGRLRARSCQLGRSGVVQGRRPSMRPPRPLAYFGRIRSRRSAPASVPLRPASNLTAPRPRPASPGRPSSPLRRADALTPDRVRIRDPARRTVLLQPWPRWTERRSDPPRDLPTEEAISSERWHGIERYEDFGRSRDLARERVRSPTQHNRQCVTMAAWISCASVRIRS